MKKSSRRVLVAVAAVAVAGVVAAVAVAVRGPDVQGVKTVEPPQLIAVRAGVQIDPMLTAGDVVGGILGGYQMSGIPDGLGAYASSRSTYELFMNHELDGAPDNARVSQLTVDDRAGVLGARYVTDGSEGFRRFCSSTLAVLNGVPWYFTGEESLSGQHGGSSIAINAQTGRWYETKHFGLMEHENVVPVQGLATAVILTTEDGDADLSQLWAYTAGSFPDAIQGNGQLWVWVADGQVPDGDPSTNDIAKGQTLQGRFVAIDQTSNTDAATLEAKAQELGAFDFTRIEDLAVPKSLTGVTYFTDTGSPASAKHVGQPAEIVRGRLYRFSLNQGDPTRASLTVLLDGDAGDNLVNPDNLDTSSRAILIQEDRNSGTGPLNFRKPNNAFPGDQAYGRVLLYNLQNGKVDVVARVATPPTLDPGEWESSGVLNAESLLGNNWWLLDVQAHKVTAPQPGPGLEVNSSSGESGQLLAIRVPGS